jgi:hypothetical protein
MVLRSSYNLASRTEPFYTGGAVVSDPAGALVACACGEETKLVTLATGSVVRVCARRRMQRYDREQTRWGRRSIANGYAGAPSRSRLCMRADSAVGRGRAGSCPVPRRRPSSAQSTHAWEDRAGWEDTEHASEPEHIPSLG